MQRPPRAANRLLPPAGYRLRSTVGFGVLVTGVWLLVRTWCIEGLVIPLLVSGGSMAQTLVGLHRDVVCADCGHQFACGTDVQPVSARAVCPNCGYEGNELRRLPDLSGDRLLVGKSVFHQRAPRRWEVVAFRQPHQARAICVKRIVGLPGETIQIRHGDVYADGQIQRKTLAQQRATAVLVHDANCSPALDPVLPARWQGERDDSQWSTALGRFTHPARPDKESVDWCVYRHWRRIAGRAGQVRQSPVTDDCGYNQTQPRRAEEVQNVTDLMLSLRLTKSFGGGRLLVRATDGRKEFLLRVDPERKRYELLCDGGLSPTCGGELPAWGGELHLEVSLFDRQLLVAVGDRTVLVQPYEASGLPPTSHPLAIGSQGLGLEIRDVRVYRDVYYSQPVGMDARWGFAAGVRLGAEEYFALGDNSPISDDSRTWPAGPAVNSNLFYGKPLLVYFPARRFELWGWSFQVPDLAKIRYIR